MKFKKRVVKGENIVSIENIQFPIEIDICFNCGSTAVGILKKTFVFVKGKDDWITDYENENDVYYSEDIVDDEQKICLNCGCSIIEKATIDIDDNNQLYAIYKGKKYKLTEDFEYIDFEKPIKED